MYCACHLAYHVYHVYHVYHSLYHVYHCSEPNAVVGSDKDSIEAGRPQSDPWYTTSDKH